MSLTSIQATLKDQNYRTEITGGDHHIIGDEPVSNGGQGTGMGPYELVLAGLALCKAATMRMYAQRKGWDAGEIQVNISLHADKDNPARFETQISFSGSLDAEQQSRMLQISEKCPTHKLLMGEKVFETILT